MQALNPRLDHRIFERGAHKRIPIRYRAECSPMCALWAPKGGDHLAGGWIDDRVPVDDDGRDRLVAVSH